MIFRLTGKQIGTTLLGSFVLLTVLIGASDSNVAPMVSLPVTVERLQIASINVDARIESVGITSEGAMDTPDAPMVVGLYEYGARPGEEGSAVIAGHQGWKSEQAAVFDDLDTLKQGDKISVLNSDGSKKHFIVRETRKYHKDALAAEVFTSESGSHLNLITCVGDWNSAEKSYSERWVVFADLVQ